MQQMTVKMLMAHLQKAIKNHPEIADKQIVVADDTEGNGYHGLFFGLTHDEETIKECIECSNGIYDSDSDNPRDIVILG